MKKHKDVQEILRRNGISGLTNNDDLSVLGGYYETFVLFDLSGTSYMANANGNSADAVTVVTGDTTLSVAVSGETYFLISGTTGATVNTIPITGNGKSSTVDTTFSGATVEAGDTVDTLDGLYYTYLGKGNFGLSFRILNLGASGSTDTGIVTVSIVATGSTTTGSTETLAANGLDASGGITTITDDVVWAVDDTDLATITSRGILTALSAGTVTVSATYNDPLSSISVSGTTSIVITNS
jgi:hypothetical protein